jgi:hypothetical protein
LKLIAHETNLAPMQRFRTIPYVIRMLVALFLLAQFAGVVSSPFAPARAADGGAIAHASHHQAGSHQASGHQAGDQRRDGCAHPDGGACDHADYCCALHAFFAGILPPVAAIDNLITAGDMLRPAVTDVALGLHPGRLDRPPRPRS